MSLYHNIYGRLERIIWVGKSPIVFWRIDCVTWPLFRSCVSVCQYITKLRQVTKTPVETNFQCFKNGRVENLVDEDRRPPLSLRSFDFISRKFQLFLDESSESYWRLSVKCPSTVTRGLLPKVNYFSTPTPPKDTSWSTNRRTQPRDTTSVSLTRQR